MSDQTEIRLLGRLWIRLGNGTVMPPAPWGAGRTSDVLRLLAMQSGQVVSTASIIEKLWPDIPSTQAAAQLHTATLQIRKALGKNSILRHLRGIQLQGCWVDVVAHQQLVGEIDTARLSCDFADVVAATRRAEALYVDDFHADDDTSAWAVELRDQLRTQRKLMLVGAAESALELGWTAEAIEMSALAVSVDPCFEPAHRALMRAYADIGEIDSAMRSYERCRRTLRMSLGVAPSQQTEKLRLQLAEWLAVPAEAVAGLVRPRNTSSRRPASAATFRVLAEQLEPIDMEICQVMTVLDRPATAVDVMELLGSGRRTESRRREIDVRLEQLTARGLFCPADGGYAFRDRATRGLFTLWMRPSLHSLISERITAQRSVLLQSG